MELYYIIIAACFISYSIGLIHFFLYFKIMKSNEVFNQSTCKHLNTKIVVIQSVVTCETTITVCADCNKQLTEPKTDCA